MNTTDHVVHDQAGLDQAVSDKVGQIVIDSPSDQPLVITNVRKSHIIVAGQSVIARCSGRIEQLTDSGHVGEVTDSGSVGKVTGSGSVGEVTGSGRVGWVSGSGRVRWVTDSGSVGEVTDSGSVGSPVIVTPGD